MKNLITNSIRLIVMSALILYLLGFTPTEPDVKPNPPEDPCWYVDIPCELND